MARQHSEPTPDLATIARDEAFMQRLSRGAQPPPADDIGVMLAAWRDDLSEDAPEPSRDRLAGLLLFDQPRLRRVSARRRGLLAAAASVVVLGGALVIGAGQAGPGSPLWPITQVLFGSRADSITAQHEAEQAIARAREAITRSQYTDAQHQLDQADGWVAKIRDRDVADRLRTEIRSLRGMLPGSSSHVTPTPGVSANPGTSGGATSGPGLPLPSLPLPSLPLPSLPLPSLPTLP
jgi:hypothetical protein